MLLIVHTVFYGLDGVSNESLDIMPTPTIQAERVGVIEP